MKLNSVIHPSSWDLPLSNGIILFVALGLAPLFGWALADERWIMAGGLGLAALVPLIIRWPVVTSFGLYAFLVPFDAVTAISEGAGATVTKLVGLFAGVVLLGAGLVEKRLGAPPRATLWWSVFLGWAIFSATWAINPDAVLQRLPTVLSLFTLYVTATCFRASRRELYWVCLLVVAGGTIAAAVGYWYGLEAVPPPKARGTLILGERSANPNTLAAVLILPLALAMAGMVGLRGALAKVVAAGALGMIGLGVYVTMSRSALMAIIAMILVLLYRLRVRWQLLSAVVMLLALTTLMPDQFFTRISAVYTGDDLGAGRLTRIWPVGVAALERFWIFGSGLSTFLDVYDMYMVTGPHRGPSGSHNTYLGTWVELGIVGLALMLGAVVSQVVAALRATTTRRRDIVLSAILAACAGMLVGVFFQERLWTKDFWLVWILLAWAVRSGPESSVFLGIVDRDSSSSRAETPETPVPR